MIGTSANLVTHELITGSDGSRLLAPDLAQIYLHRHPVEGWLDVFWGCVVHRRVVHVDVHIGQARQRALRMRSIQDPASGKDK